MGKGKLAKFAEMETFKNVFQYPYSVIDDVPFEMKGHWREQYFGNDNPIVLELGCGKGEYAVGLARMFPNINFIGVDIKGARMWTGAKMAIEEGLTNVAFLRTNIEIIDRFFAPNEVQEIWLTFSDPQMKNARKRLTSTYFMERYRHFLTDRGLIHLKTDSNFLFTYTTYMVERNQLRVLLRTEDLYHTEGLDEATREILGIHTYYENQWIERGLNIRYMKFELPHEGELTEPDVEIPLDEYRSYHRTKRSSKDTANHNKSVFTLLLLLLPTLVVMGKETSNSRQARKIFDHTYQMVYGRQGSTLSYSVNIIGLYKAAGTIWMQGKKSRSEEKRYSIWNDGKTYYKVDKVKKKVEIYRANDPERDKYSGMFNFDADNFVYSVKAAGNTFVVSLDAKEGVKGIKHIKAIIDKKTRAPLSLRLKFGIIWVTVKITHFKSGGISASTFAFPKHRYHNYKVIDNR